MLELKGSELVVNPGPPDPNNLIVLLLTICVISGVFTQLFPVPPVLSYITRYFPGKKASKGGFFNGFML